VVSPAGDRIARFSNFARSLFTSVEETDDESDGGKERDESLGRRVGGRGEEASQKVQGEFFATHVVGVGDFQRSSGRSRRSVARAIVVIHPNFPEVLRSLDVSLLLRDDAPQQLFALFRRSRCLRQRRGSFVFFLLIDFVSSSCVGEGIDVFTAKCEDAKEVEVGIVGGVAAVDSRGRRSGRRGRGVVDFLQGGGEC